MSSALITEAIWPQLSRTASRARQACYVAVAYFGVGANRLLPLPRNSWLVVDASERAVASGQTSPAELGKLLKRGVRIFSSSNLHAKVFVFGRAAFVGSTNASGRSASQLVEAVIRTTHRNAVEAAKRFVRDQCLHELTPGALARLKKVYRPPKVPGGKNGQPTAKSAPNRPAIPRVLIARLDQEDLSRAENAVVREATATAQKLRQKRRSYTVETFKNSGTCPYRRGDVIVQVTVERNGRVLVSPPGNVLYVRRYRLGRQTPAIVCVELPVRRRKEIRSMAKSLGRGALKRLSRDGVVRELAFARALLTAWA